MLPSAFRTALFTLLLLSPASEVVAAISADAADDVCAAEANPCIVTEQVDIVAGSVLDFGQRELRIEGGGVLDFGSGVATVRSGKLVVTSEGEAAAIRASGAGPAPDAERRIEVRRMCSETAQTCFRDADCSLGTCSVGDGSVDLGGPTELDLAYPHAFSLHAAGDIAIRAPFDVTSDEAQVNIVAGVGGVTFEAPLQSNGERGVFLFVQSGGDILVDAPVDGHGEMAGGQLGIFAGGDLVVLDDVRARALVEGTTGGQLFLFGQDVRVEGGTAEDPVELFGGFVPDHVVGAEGDGLGGWIDLEAGRDLMVAEHTEVRSDGRSELVTFTSARDIFFDGTVSALTHGSGNRSPLSWLAAGRDLHFLTHARLDILGEEGAEAGGIWIEGLRDADVAGRIRFSGVEPALPDGDVPPIVQVNGCTVRVLAGADLLNTSEGSSNRIKARTALEIEEGVSWTCEGCTNEARVRDEENPLSLAGEIVPPMTVVEDGALLPCTNCAEGLGCDDADSCTLGDLCTGDVCRGIRDVGCGDCGSSTVEWGEGCDDGDETYVPGEACAADCQWMACGHPTGSPGIDPSAADALFVLRTSVGMQVCAVSVCDANRSQSIEASDALLVLRAAVGLENVTCPLPLT